MTRRYPFQSAHANKQRMIKKQPKSVKNVVKNTRYHIKQRQPITRPSVKATKNA